ncbi:MAG: hypothetical protein Q4G27_07385 [Flavobacteriaceae bacterium]|nr:hypothetical protein [Flavobacteriaceae bacterium]
MKKLLLLSLSVVFILSCSEYNDDGTPGGIVITNPDGTKKIKNFSSNSNGVTSFDFGMESQNMNLTNTLNRSYASDSYSNESEMLMSTSISGIESEGNDALSQRLNEIINGVKITEISTIDMASGVASRTKYAFNYNENQLSAFTYTSDGIAQGNGSITSTADQINVSTSSTSQDFIPMNWIFNLTDGLITSATATSVDSGTEFDINFTRANGNITALEISSAVSTAYTYTYDTNINPFHQVYTNNLDQTNAEIVRLISSGFQPQAAGAAIDVSNLESMFRIMLIEGKNNLLSANSGSQVLQTNSYTYDADGYPITMTSRLSQKINLSGSIDSYLADYQEMLQGMGLTPEEIEGMLAEIQQQFQGEIDVDMTTEATINYYE